MTDRKIEKIVQYSFYLVVIELFLSGVRNNNEKLIPQEILAPVILLTSIVMIFFFCFYYFRKGYRKG